MKLNGTPPHYMPLSQSQSDDEENTVSNKALSFEKSICYKHPDISSSFDKKNESYIAQKDDKCMPMSPVRTVAFIFSLLLCVIFIGVFVLLLPCNQYNFEVNVIEKWALKFPNISFTTGIVLSFTRNDTSPILLFGYLFMGNDSSETGVIGLRKTDGYKLFQQALPYPPTSILCNSIDVNNDGLNDCLVYGSDGLLCAIDVIKGVEVWFIHSHKSAQVIDSFTLPTVLTDCDGDEVRDIVVSYANEKNNTYFGLVSGRTGELMSPIHIGSCVSTVKAALTMNWKNVTALIFYCSKGYSGDVMLAFAQDICDVALMKTDSLNVAKIYRTAPYFSQIQLQRSEFNNELIISINGTAVVFLHSTGIGKFKVKWTSNFKNSHWRGIVNGIIPQLLLVGGEALHSKVVSLNMSNGHKVWSAQFNNSIVTSVLSIPTQFQNFSTVILKKLTPLNYLQLNPGEKKQNESVIDPDTEHLQIPSNESSLRLAEESYILLNSNHSMKELTSQNIWHTCKGEVCKPDLYTSKDTAVATMSPDGTVDLSVITSSLSTDSKGLIQTIVKVIKLEHLKTTPRCLYHLGS